MKTIDKTFSKKCRIKIHKIKPFINICRVTGKKEKCNVEVEYCPNFKFIELESFREYFKQEFNEYIEDLCLKVFNQINYLISPRELKVTVFLIDEKLTPWEVTIEK